ncbi:hypothetical protein HD553DRAFT_345519 [Filobasidium floriforme]|uniref:uncharacterized protein n=1 Tax=Filobasidium floriforme TaxID=5210 RepID=UPI001E8D3E67|nr:uncharacterized protein HD553DRAFT_345519 [Filobasidium floriforme]KAH8079751.1 hypothetical protein HD553DRAFT_345519 [Filobasidium floriforme]
MTDRSVVYAQTDLTAGGDDHETFWKRLVKAGLEPTTWVDSRHDSVIALIRSPKHLPKGLEQMLIRRLMILSKKLRRDPEASEAYLESNMNQIIEATIGQVDRVEVYHNSIPWNRIPPALSRVVGLSSPVPDGSVGYPALGKNKHGDLVETPADPKDPLGRQVLEYILKTSYAEKVPLNHTNVQKTIDIHDVLLFEYMNKDGVEQKAVSHNQSLNIGMFKVWQDVDLADFLDQEAHARKGQDHGGEVNPKPKTVPSVRLRGKWINAISRNPPFCLVFRICGTYWALDYIAANPPLLSFRPRTIYQTIVEGNWMKNAGKFLRTLKAAYCVCVKRVKEFRGGMMSDLHNFAKAEVAKRGLGVMPKDGLKPRIYRKRPPIREVSNRLANENAQAAKDCAEEGDA